ncbi:MAG: NPCBM/NEW2 domain-containing protein, partial [Verrucomicrobia bacterium]|nr:NPCBM/NEW2 domain-containing protein [Verrucomicrobiota bacterium]
MKRTLFAVVLGFACACQAAETVSLTSLDLANLHFEGWSKPKVDKAFSGRPLSIAGQKFQNGIGTRALSTLWLELDGRAQKFLASVGVDDGAPNEAASVCFTVIGDGKKLWTSGAMKR